MATVVGTLNQGLAVLQGASRGANPYPLYFGIGTSSAAFDPTHTNLQAPSAESHSLAVATAITVNQANDTIHLVGAITSGSGQTIREIGQYTSGGLCVRRAVLDSSLYVVLVNGQDIDIDLSDIFS